MNRRVFLRNGAFALVSLGFVPSFLTRTARAAGSRRKILIAVFQRGAVDGLNLVVPFREDAYYAARPTIAVARPGTGDNAAVDLDGFFGLHPRLAPLKAVYDAGHLALVHAVGSPVASHPPTTDAPTKPRFPTKVIIGKRSPERNCDFQPLS